MFSVRSFQLGLFQMSDGRPHPDATEPIIIGTEFGPWRTINEISIQATGCRLAVKVTLVGTPTDEEGTDETHENLFIWDWRTGQKYFVSDVPSFVSRGFILTGSIIKDYPYPRIRSMCFIDDYHLLGVVDRKSLGQEVVLWDAAILGDTRIPRQLVFELGPSHKTLNLIGEEIVCDLESNCELPFRADPSMQLVGIKVTGGCAWFPGHSRVLLIRSEVLSGFASRIEMTSTIRWEDWSHFAKPIRIGRLYDVKVHLSHSHLICPGQSVTRNPPRLRVFNFSLECKRREGGSGVIGEYSEQLIPVNEEISDRDFYLSTSNIIFPRTDSGLVSPASIGACSLRQSSTQSHPQR